MEAVRWIFLCVILLAFIRILAWINVCGVANPIGSNALFPARYSAAPVESSATMGIAHDDRWLEVSAEADQTDYLASKSVMNSLNNNHSPDRYPIVNGVPDANVEHNQGNTSFSHNRKTHRDGNHISNVDKYYLTTSSKGRLGNQMFQYAALFALTRRNQTWIPYMKERRSFHCLRKTFNQSLSIDELNFGIENSKRIFVEAHVDVVLRSLGHLPEANLTLHGFFQSHKYFADFRHELRNEYTFSREVQEAVFRFFKRVTPVAWKEASFERVGIHVRRTDLLQESRRRSGFISPPPSYYLHAIDYFRQKYGRVQFFVASDDLAWCKANIVAEHVQYSDQHYVVDLAVLSLSDHVIISVGTYSWWAGWLCKGTTVYYGEMPPNGTYVGELCRNDSYIPVPDDEYNHWVPIV